MLAEIFALRRALRCSDRFVVGYPSFLSQARELMELRGRQFCHTVYAASHTVQRRDMRALRLQRLDAPTYLSIETIAWREGGISQQRIMIPKVRNSASFLHRPAAILRSSLYVKMPKTADVVSSVLGGTSVFRDPARRIVPVQRKSMDARFRLCARQETHRPTYLSCGPSLKISKCRTSLID